MKPIEIRLDPVETLNDRELEEVVILINEANADRRGPFRGDRIDKPSLVETYRGCTVIRAFDEYTLTGTVTIKPASDALWIYLLAVAPASRGSGLSAQLLSAAIEAANSIGAQELFLEAVDTGNLVRYYERMGFAETARKRMPTGHWGSAEAFDLVSMTYSING